MLKFGQGFDRAAGNRCGMIVSFPNSERYQRHEREGQRCGDAEHARTAPQKCHRSARQTNSGPHD
jgi:hypothetical protein